MRVALQMDALSAIEPATDSTVALGSEALAREYELFHYLPEQLSWIEGKILAPLTPLCMRDGRLHPESAPKITDLAELDVILLRQDPPFDMAYVSSSFILEALMPSVLVCNNPFWVRNSPEKLMVQQFPSLIPPSLISRDPEQIKEFRARHGAVVFKPLYGNGGESIFVCREDDPNFQTFIELFCARAREPFLVQKFLPGIRTGDKRIILVDGNSAGAINRVPASGSARANLHVGGRAEKTKLTERERQICTAIAPTLRARGLVFAGIDVIDGMLTEINVTSPTGLREIARFEGTKIERLIWDAIEDRKKRDS